MNKKSIVLTLMLCALLISLASIRLSSQASATEDGKGSKSTADETMELTWSLEVRIRLPILKKDAT